MRFFVELSYRGEPFHGWQIQPGAVSVQEVIEKALSTIARHPVPVTGAGRTDAGVNARRMIAHFDYDSVPDAAMLRALDSLCGRDIAIHSIRRVKDDAHARFDATARTYRYFVTTRKNPFARELAWKAPATLDFDAMNEAARLIIGRRDFTSFSKLHTDVKTNICDLREARWHRIDDEGAWYFEITADRFLRNMVRAVVGTLVDVGRGKMKPEDIITILDRRDRCAAGTSMPGGALFLWDVAYPDNIYIPDSATRE
ncbi:MAG: tRNA pseudouridine(38-40) synthase TruA [Muribaculaceae bacterium]|nr:tRNA pseudouridine(38-40) synthase TruA [Muribaculaceae bacterium]